MTEIIYLTTRETAKELAISSRRVRALIATGQLPATKLGRDWIIRIEDLELVRDRQPGRPRKE